MNKLDGLVCNCCRKRVFHLENGLCADCIDNKNGKVNNFNLIDKLLYYSDTINNNFYYLIQVIQRSKDTELNTNKVIKSYYISTRKQYWDLEKEIITLCKTFRARAYIQLNPKHSRDICKCIVDEFINKLYSGNTDCFAKYIPHSIATDFQKTYYLVDVDTKNYETESDIVPKVEFLIRSCRGNVDSITEIPTVSGWHLITTPFDVNQFYQLLEINHLDKYEVKKQAMTLLYCDLFSN